MPIKKPYLYKLDKNSTKTNQQFLKLLKYNDDMIGRMIETKNLTLFQTHRPRPRCETNVLIKKIHGMTSNYNFIERPKTNIFLEKIPTDPLLRPPPFQILSTKSSSMEAISKSMATDHRMSLTIAPGSSRRMSMLNLYKGLSKLEKTSTGQTNEIDLLPESFKKKPSSSAFASEFPRFTTFIETDLGNKSITKDANKKEPPKKELLKKDINKKGPIKNDAHSTEPISDPSRNLNTFMDNTVEGIRTRKTTLSFKEIHYCPIVPNYVIVDMTPLEPSLMEEEDDEFALSIIYTNLMIENSGRIKQRTFSGSYFYRFHGKHKHHSMYYGNFGFVDGIITESSPLFSRGNKVGSIKKEMLNNPEGMSRESFLALSHMFNLRKLLGKNHQVEGNKTTKSIFRPDEKKTIRFDRHYSNSDSSEDSNSQSESVESVDFTLMNEFTQRLAQEVKKMDKGGKSGLATLKTTKFVTLVEEESSLPDIEPIDVQTETSQMPPKLEGEDGDSNQTPDDANEGQTVDETYSESILIKTYEPLKYVDGELSNGELSNGELSNGELLEEDNSRSSNNLKSYETNSSDNTNSGKIEEEEINNDPELAKSTDVIKFQRK